MVERRPNDQLIELLEENIIGTPGESMLYKHKNVRSKVSTIPEPYFANLYIRKRLYGTICLSKRNVQTLGKKHQAFYLRYFTFRERFRAAVSKEPRKDQSSLIRDEVANLMNGNGLDYDGDLVLYAYVDPENIRSKRLIEEFGFKKVGVFHTIPFSRVYPRSYNWVEQLVNNDRADVQKLLGTAYENEQLISFEHLLSRGEYFVIREGNIIICGVQAIKDSWEILNLPGIGGRFLMSLVPKLPLLGRLFNPQYNFVFLESLYCASGKEREMGILLEAVLAHYKLYSGILCLDPKSELYTLVKKVKLGLTHKIMGEKKIEIVAKTSNQQLFNKELPFFVSGYDVL